MAAKAFVLVEVMPGKVNEAVRSFGELGEKIKSVDRVTGPYDVIVVVEGQDLHDIGNFVTGLIHPMSIISRTVTCLVI